MIRPMFKSLSYRLVSSLEALKLTVSLRRYAGRLKVIIGSASTRQQGWVSTNYPTLDLTDERTFHTLFKRKEAVERFLAEHVWEHLSLGQAEVAARMQAVAEEMQQEGLSFEQRQRLAAELSRLGEEQARLVQGE